MSGQHADPHLWFDGIDRVLFVHAHPDDETIATGGTLAALASVGRDPAVLTLTRGERGEVTPGPFAHLVGTPALAPHREHELRAALTALGVTSHLMLGTPPARAQGEPRVYEDSGMVWGDDGLAVASPERSALALTSAPAVDVVNDVLHAALAAEAGVIVSYDAIGGYGHPDHVLAHRAARAVAVALEVPFWEIVTTDDESDDVARYDIEAWCERKVMALRMHGTQLSVVSDTELEHVGGQRQAIARTECFRKR